MTGKGDITHAHTHVRTQWAEGEGGAYTFNVQVKCEAYAPRNVRVSASVYQCVSVYHCISVSPGTLYICMYVCVLGCCCCLCCCLGTLLRFLLFYARAGAAAFVDDKFFAHTRTRTSVARAKKDKHTENFQFF